MGQEYKSPFLLMLNPTFAGSIHQDANQSVIWHEAHTEPGLCMNKNHLRR